MGNNIPAIPAPIVPEQVRRQENKEKMTFSEKLNCIGVIKEFNQMVRSDRKRARNEEQSYTVYTDGPLTLREFICVQEEFKTVNYGVRKDVDPMIRDSWCVVIWPTQPK